MVAPYFKACAKATDRLHGRALLHHTSVIFPTSLALRGLVTPHPVRVGVALLFPLVQYCTNCCHLFPLFCQFCFSSGQVDPCFHSHSWSFIWSSFWFQKDSQQSPCNEWGFTGFTPRQKGTCIHIALWTVCGTIQPCRSTCYWGQKIKRRVAQAKEKIVPLWVVG